MGCRDPALVVRLRTRGNRRAVGTNNGNLVRGIDLLGATGGPLSALAALAATLLLREESGDPGVVDEVDGSAESAEDDQIEEDTNSMHVSLHSMKLAEFVELASLTDDKRLLFWSVSCLSR
jgi:hypothetical protein